jgi:hypothetical protein
LFVLGAIQAATVPPLVPSVRGLYGLPEGGQVLDKIVSDLVRQLSKPHMGEFRLGRVYATLG